MTREFTPRPYQLDMAKHILEHERCALFAQMGLGKTVSTLTALNDLFSLGIETKPALVLAPLRVAQNVWPDEAKKWSHLSNIEVQPIIGDRNDRIAALNKPASVYAVNYENIKWLLEHLDGKWPYGVVVCDEASKLKSLRVSIRASTTGKKFISGQGGKRARALAKVAYRNRGRWINLTGTPCANSVADLYGPTWFLDFGQRLGNSFDAFTRRWFEISYDGFTLVPRPYAQQQIQDAIKDICLSLRSEDYFDIEKPIKNFIRVELPSKARIAYRKMEKELFLQLGENNIEAFNAASKTIKCLQLANGCIYTDDEKNYTEVHDVKIQALESIINEAAGAPVLVAYHFRSDLDRLKKAFPKARVLDKDPKTIRDWNARKIPLLFAHPQSCGHGLNLADGGNILVFFSINWNLEEHEQIIERIGPVRQKQAGLERNVFLHYIIAAGTIEEDVLERLETKKSVQDCLLEAMRRR